MNIYFTYRPTKQHSGVECYIQLRCAITFDGNAGSVGKHFILPSSFVGGPRYMFKKTQDAMSYVWHYGRQELFMIFTCNPKWREIELKLFEHQKSYDKHGIVSRVFQ